MEIQVENHGSNVDLNIVLVWFWLFHVGFQTWCQFFSIKAMLICTYTFLNHKLFEKSLHACPYCFSIAKGLAAFRLGGVISTQKVQFGALFEIGFECFLCTNHIK